MKDELQDIINELERLYQHKWDPDLGIQIIRLKLLLLNKNISMKDKLKDAAYQMFCTKIGWLVISCILVIVFGAFSTQSTLIDDGYLWCDYAMFICLIYPIVLTFIMIGYAIKNVFWKGGNK